jgi:hypothetical protein
MPRSARAFNGERSGDSTDGKRAINVSAEVIE